MAGSRKFEDIRKAERRSGPRTGGGDGAAYGSGYGAGGLGSGADRLTDGEAHRAPRPWDAPGVAPDGRRTGTPTDGPRIAMDEESEPDPPGDQAADRARRGDRHG